MASVDGTHGAQQASGVDSNEEVKGSDIKNATGDVPSPKSEVDTKSIIGRDAIAGISPKTQANVMDALIAQVE